MLIFVKKDTPEAAIRSLVIQLSRQGIGTARADSAGRTMLTLVGETWTLGRAAPAGAALCGGGQTADAGVASGVPPDPPGGHGGVRG